MTGLRPESEFYGRLILAGRMHDSRNKWNPFGFESLEFFGRV
jgi:hypothetical protein